MLTEDQLKNIGGSKVKAIHDAMHEAIDELCVYLGPEFPKLGNKTPAVLVDQVGGFKLLEKHAKKIIETLNGIIESKLDGKKEMIGSKYKLQVRISNRYALNQGRAKEKLLALGGQKVLDECMDDTITDAKYYIEI